LTVTVFYPIALHGWSISLGSYWLTV
jgi:hypothetical protein